MKESEQDVANMSALLAICIHHYSELFSLPDELIHSVDDSIKMQREDSSFQLDSYLQVILIYFECIFRQMKASQL